jgi:hypothetical protein
VDSDDGEDTMFGCSTEKDGMGRAEGVGVGSSDDGVDSDNREDMISGCGAGEDGTVRTEGAAGSDWCLLVDVSDASMICLLL